MNLEARKAETLARKNDAVSIEGLDELRATLANLYQHAKDIGNGISDDDDESTTTNTESALEKVAFKTREAQSRLGQIFQANKDSVSGDVFNKIDVEDIDPVYHRIGWAYSKLVEHKRNFKK